MSEKKRCIKCLLAELDNKQLLADVQEAVRRLADDMKVPEGEYTRRLEICKECDYLNEGTCNACGCYVELRAAAKSGKCPYNKWNEQKR